MATDPAAKGRDMLILYTHLRVAWLLVVAVSFNSLLNGSKLLRP